MPPGPNSSHTVHESTGVRVVPSLTGIEREILDFVVSYLLANTYQPSVREIGHRFGIKSTKTVSEHLQALADKGYVERDPARARGLRILGMDLNGRTVSLPCFRNLRDATTPSRDGRAEGRISLDRELAGRGAGFAVRAPGERLAAAGIGGGDVLVIQPVRADELADGDIVVGRVGGAAEYFQLTMRRSRFFFRAVGRDPAGPPHGAQGAEPVIIGRLAVLYRPMSAPPVPASATAH